MSTTTYNSDIFGRAPLQFGGAFAADSAQINLTLDCLDNCGCPITSTGLLTQQIQIQYQQPIQRLFEIGSQNTYYVAGRPQGTASMARIVGPGIIMAELYACLGNVCNSDGNDLCFCVEGGCGTAAGDKNPCGPQTDCNLAMKLCLTNVVMQSLGMTVQAADMLINEQMSLYFMAMAAKSVPTCGALPTYSVTCPC